MLLDQEGVGVELSRQSYEEGDWAGAVEEAWAKGQEARWKKRRDGAAGIGIRKREEEGMALARKVVDWVEDWWAHQSDVPEMENGFSNVAFPATSLAISGQ
jgi:hypothetical protein